MKKRHQGHWQVLLATVHLHLPSMASFVPGSEFMSPSATHFNPLVHLCFTDVSFTPEGCLTLHLKSSKTDPYRQGCSLLIAPYRRSVCAVRALRKYLSLHSVSGASPLYVFQSGAYLTRAKVTLTLRTLLRRLSIRTELYVSRSFRISPASTAAEAGLPTWLIQTLRRWSSNCFSLYIRTPPSILQKVPEMLATCVHHALQDIIVPGHYSTSSLV